MMESQPFQVEQRDEFLIFHCVNLSGFAEGDLPAQAVTRARGGEFASAKHVIVDVKDLAYANSMFLETLVQLGRFAKERQGRLSLCNVEPYVQQVLQISHLDTLWKSYDSIESTITDQRQQDSDSA